MRDKHPEPAGPPEPGHESAPITAAPQSESFSGPPLPLQAPLSEGPGTRIGPYRLLQLIGEGGFGSVFLADQEAPVRRRVALKVIKLGMDTRSVVARFEQERQALAVMDHPGIARVLDAGATATGRPYFVMELVKGEPITEYCDKNSLTVAERLDLFLQVCQALQHAHQKGIIHRDIKPSNILVAVQDGHARAKVIDFGVAKATDHRLTEKTIFTEHRQLIGTPEYMSPEQAEGSLDVDTRTDVYSLGVLLYELLTGSTPFDSRSLRSAAYDQIQRMIREVEPPRPSTRLSSLQDSLGAVAARRRVEPRRLSTILRGDLDWVVMKALEKDRSRRYDSPGSFAEDIERYLRDEPVSAGPPTTSYKVRKFLRRHRAATSVAAAFVLLLIAGLVATSLLYQRASRERASAMESMKKANEERRRTAEEMAKVHAAFDFVNGMFSSIDPAVARGRDISVREILDSAAARLDSTLKDQPAVESAVRESIGEAYHHIARYEAAEANLRRSYELRQAQLGPDDPETLVSLNNLGAALLELGRTKEATDALRRAADGREKVLGARHADTLASRSLLAYAIQLSGDLPAAEAAIRAVIADQTLVRGKNHRETIESRTSLADMLQTQGKEAEAIVYATELAADAAKSLGEDDPLTIDARSILAAILKDAGREAEAETVIRAVIASKTRIYGPDRPDTLLSEDVLASTLRNEDKFEEAEKISRSVVERSRKVNGTDHSATLTYINNLAQTLREAKKLDQAEPLYREVLAARRTAGDARQTCITLTNLALLLRDKDQPAEALSLLQEATAGFAKILPADHWMIGMTRVYSGDCFSALNLFPEAEKEITAGYQSITAALGPTHPRAKTAAKSATAMYARWGKPDEAATWEAKAAPSK